MKTCVVVPIKTNNKRLTGKTFRELGGKPLYSYLFSTLKKLGNEIDTYIDSSDEKVLEIAEKWGFQTLKRPKKYNQDHVTGDELIMRDINNLNSDIIGLLHITSPFLTSETIKKSIYTIEQNPQLDSAFGVTPRYNRFWYKNKPVNHDIIRLVATQNLVPVHEEADFYFFRRKSFEKYKKRVCGNFQTIEVSNIEAVDIDTLEDLLYAETLIEKGLIRVSQSL